MIPKTSRAQNRKLQNLAALRAIAAGVEGEMVEVVAAQMVAEGTLRVDRAEEILGKMRVEK